MHGITHLVELCDNGQRKFRSVVENQYLLGTLMFSREIWVVGLMWNYSLFYLAGQLKLRSEGLFTRPTSDLVER